jgi:hypothetical protein
LSGLRKPPELAIKFQQTLSLEDLLRSAHQMLPSFPESLAINHPIDRVITKVGMNSLDLRV